MRTPHASAPRLNAVPALNSNLPFNITAEEMYDIFGKYGAVRQIRLCVAPPCTRCSASLCVVALPCRGGVSAPRALPLRRVLARSGTTKDTRGTAYVVYEDIYDAKAAADHLSGFNVANRYLIVLYYAPSKQAKKLDQARCECCAAACAATALTRLRSRTGVAQRKKEEELAALKAKLAAAQQQDME